MRNKMPLVIKEVNLPFDYYGVPMSYEEYKATYGIDLADFFVLEPSGELRYKNKEPIKFNVVISNVGLNSVPMCGVINTFNNDSPYAEGLADMHVNIGVYTAISGNALGLLLSISKDDPYEWGSVTIEIWEN